MPFLLIDFTSYKITNYCNYFPPKPESLVINYSTKYYQVKCGIKYGDASFLWTFTLYQHFQFNKSLTVSIKTYDHDKTIMADLWVILHKL